MIHWSASWKSTAHLSVYLIKNKPETRNGQTMKLALEIRVRLPLTNEIKLGKQQVDVVHTQRERTQKHWRQNIIQVICIISPSNFFLLLLRFCSFSSTERLNSRFIRFFSYVLNKSNWIMVTFLCSLVGL